MMHTQHIPPGQAPHQEPHDTEDVTHFGFHTVPVGEKKARVREVFDSVASRYDLMNDLMSLGVHRLWKRAFVSWLSPRPGRRYLDVGGGTGDIALRILECLRTQGETGITGPDVLVCDINHEMIQTGRNRAIDQGYVSGLEWAVGNAEALPCEDASVDAYTIAFCLRNVTDIDATLREAKRVLKPGGRFLCLEFSRVVWPGVDKLYNTYSFQVLPRLGQLVTHNRDAYQYLVESIRRFPSQENLARRIKEAGLSQVKVRNLSGGIAAMHSAWRL